MSLQTIEPLNNNSHGLLPPGGLVSFSGGFVSLLCDQGLHFASIKLSGILDVTRFLSLDVTVCDV